jgi:hypothetical protein
VLESNAPTVSADEDKGTTSCQECQLGESVGRRYAVVVARTDQHCVRPPSCVGNSRGSLAIALELVVTVLGGGDIVEEDVGVVD